MKKVRLARIMCSLWGVVYIIYCIIFSLAFILPLRMYESFPEDRFIIGKYFLVLLLAGAVFWKLLAIGVRGLRQIEAKGEQSKDGGVKSDFAARKKLVANCPQCGRSLKGATQDMIGDIGVCPKCKAEFVIGQKDTESEDKQRQ